MTPRAFFESNEKAKVEAVARAAGTTFNNFRHIALYNGACSAKLAKKLQESSKSAMTINEILFPGDFPDVSDDTAA